MKLKKDTDAKMLDIYDYTDHLTSVLAGMKGDKDQYVVKTTTRALEDLDHHKVRLKPHGENTNINLVGKT